MVSVEKAYLSMFSIVEKYYNKTKSDDIGMFLGAMNPEMVMGNMSADPAYWEEWLRCVKETHGSIEEFTEMEAFQCMISFLEWYNTRYFFDLVHLLQSLALIHKGQKSDYLDWDDWNASLNGR